METTSSSDEWFQEPEIGDDGLPIEGTGIAFKDYMAQDLKTKGLMEQEILRRYIENNDLDGINASWQNEYILEPAKKILTKWAAQQLQNDIIENARVERNGYLNEINLDINEFDFNTVLKPVEEGEEVSESEETVDEGGETEFLNQEVKINPERGKLILFPPFWTHEHRGVTLKEGTKYIATTWIVFK